MFKAIRWCFASFILLIVINVTLEHEKLPCMKPGGLSVMFIMIGSIAIGLFGYKGNEYD